MKIWLKIVLGFLLTASGIGAVYATARAVKKEKRKADILTNKKGGNVADGGDQPLPSGTQGVFFGTTRGLRNNNPLNIRKSADTWEGQIGTDGEFVIFKDLEHGARAAIKLIKNYSTKYGLNTIEKVINRWAPTNENDTQNYISQVVQKTGIDAQTPLTLNAQDTYCRIAQAMAKVETGSTLPINIFHSGWQLV